MRKFWWGFVAPLVALIAFVDMSSAQTTITLGQKGGFGALKQFYDIPNDAGATINLTLSTTYSSIYLTVDGVTCSSPVGDPPFATQIVNAPLSCADGSSAILNASFHYTRRYVSSGRAHYYVTLWTLDGGTLAIL
jgi:hypothetical protein